MVRVLSTRFSRPRLRPSSSCKDNKVLTKFYDNGFTLDDTQLLQSASKTIAGVIGSRLVDDGLLDTATKVDNYLEDFEGMNFGEATVQQVLDMTSGAPNLLDYHTPGADVRFSRLKLVSSQEWPTVTAIT
jgi:CubicO group peptidase (beta-lactamase class C family)